MEQPSIDLEKLLESDHIIQIQPQGYSMYPLLVPGRDEVLITKTDPARARRGDVLLYRRDSGILVLHRVFRHRRDGLYMVGDNQVETEGPLRPEQVRGKMIAVIRNGRHISVHQPVYVAASHIWLLLRRFRPLIGKIVHRIHPYRDNR